MTGGRGRRGAGRRRDRGTILGVFPGPVLGVVAAATCFTACEEAVELVDELAAEGVADAGGGTDDDDDDAMLDAGTVPDCTPPGERCQPDVDPSQCCQDVGEDPEDDDDRDDVARVVCRPSGGGSSEFRCTPVP